MKFKNRRSGRTLLLAASLMLPGFVGAVCTQADFRGTWYATGVAGDVYNGALTEYDKCKLVVASTGNVVANGSGCVFRTYRGLSSAAITSGIIRVSNACAVSGYVVARFSNGASLRYTIEFGQMARDKNIATFTGYRNANPDVIFSYTAVKQ